MIVFRPQNAILSPKITLLFIALFYIFNWLAWSDPGYVSFRAHFPIVQYILVRP